MTRDDIEAAAWRSIRVASRPLVQLETGSPRAIVRAAHLRRELRQAAATRRAHNDNGSGGGDAA